MSARAAAPACVVTGMGVVSAAGVGVESFRRAVLEGRSGARDAPHLTSPRHQPPRAAFVTEGALAPRQHPAGGRDRAFVLAELAAGEACAAARLDGGEVGLVLGTTLAGAVAAQRWHADRLAGAAGRRRDLLQAPLDAIADYLVRRFGLAGPRLVISNACVSGANAVGLAADLVRSGEVERVLAGGVDSLHSFNFVGFANLGALARDYCRPFLPAGQGMLLGEAAAFLVLESASSAKRRGVPGLAEIAGYGASCDAFHVTAPRRDGRGARRAIEAALSEAGAGTDEVDLVLLHGVGTEYLDAMEATAMADLFDGRTSPLAAASLRPVTGHTLGGVGALDTVAAVLCLAEGAVPPTGTEGDATRLRPSVRLERRRRARPLEVVVNTSSGFGGVNAALVLRRWAGE